MLKDQNILSVDGICPKGLNLSHWPGNRTPQAFKADTSTEICLNFIESPDYLKANEEYFVISNNHYDTDGFLSVAAILYPELSLDNKEHLIQTAVTGDFRRYTTDSALKLDLTVSNLSSNPNSALFEKVKSLSDKDKRQLQYDYLLKHYNILLKDIKQFENLWIDEYNIIQSELKEEAYLELSYDSQLDLSIIYLKKNIHEITLKTFCKGTRILSILEKDNSYLYDFQYCVESWFELVSETILERRDLTKLISALNNEENNVQWKMDDLSSPVPHLKLYDSNKTNRLSSIPPKQFIDLIKNALL